MSIVRQLNIVRTSYGTGPYIITDVSGPCTCPEYLRHIDGDDTPSEPHYHLTCRDAERPDRGDYWLNGYRLDGTSVWNGNELIAAGEARGQFDMFGGAT